MGQKVVADSGSGVDDANPNASGVRFGSGIGDLDGRSDLCRWGWRGMIGWMGGGRWRQRRGRPGFKRELVRCIRG